MIYVLLTPIISFTSIIANKTVDINLFSVFKVKLESFNYKSKKLDLLTRVTCSLNEIK